MNPNGNGHDSDAVLTQGVNSAIIKQKLEYVTNAELALLKRLRDCSNATIIVTVGRNNQPIGWTVLYKWERPPATAE